MNKRSGINKGPNYVEDCPRTILKLYLIFILDLYNCNGGVTKCKIYVLQVVKVVF